jgi:hypothetical protein
MPYTPSGRNRNRRRRRKRRRRRYLDNIKR